MRYLVIFATLVICFVFAGEACVGSCSEGDHRGGICRPILTSPEAIELGKAGVFSWSCQGGDKAGSGYYVVFIRPAGTYVLLKVPEHRTSFEFTPDAVGAWRWIVINTDPDGTKPDVESESTNFQVVRGRILHEHDRK